MKVNTNLAEKIFRYIEIEYPMKTGLANTCG